MVGAAFITMSSFGGWESAEAWRLAQTIDNTEALYRDAWIVFQDYKDGTFTLMESVNELSEILEVHGYEYSYCVNDLIEIITEQE